MKIKILYILLIIVLCKITIINGQSIQSNKQAFKELKKASETIKGFKIIDIKKPEGVVVLNKNQSITIENIRGIAIDTDPPQFQSSAKKYSKEQADNLITEQAPYYAKGIKPFRFKYFNCEFNYGGWHNFNLADYSSLHGFNIIYPYTRTPDEKKHLPINTKWLIWSNFVNWNDWMRQNGMEAGRYDKLTDINVEKILIGSNIFKKTPGYQYLMIDYEHEPLSMAQLRLQKWYPKSRNQDSLRNFEQKYYTGYALSFIASAKAARSENWERISFYGWQPVPGTWFGLSNKKWSEQQAWKWNMYGEKIYNEIDVVQPSVYCYYWTPKNVAYTLANIDMNIELVNKSVKKKTVIPYFWPLLHGGDAEIHWWTEQPIANEEMRAITSLSFFTGTDGFTLWNWSGTGNHNIIEPPLTRKNTGPVIPNLMVKENFEVNKRPISKYDILKILKWNEKNDSVSFQIIDKSNKDKNWGFSDIRNNFNSTISYLKPHIRAFSEPVSAVIEGMALIKPFEYLIKNGSVKIDVSPIDQFNNTLPVIRRVKLSSIHIICTYDPSCIYGGSPRNITLENFDGNAGLSIILPADSETRIFVLNLN